VQAVTEWIPSDLVLKSPGFSLSVVGGGLLAGDITSHLPLKVTGVRIGVDKQAVETGFTHVFYGLLAKLLNLSGINPGMDAGAYLRHYRLK
jgi:hypothetical protein